MDISYLLFLQSFRFSTPWMTSLMRLFSELGAGTLAIIVTSIVYWCLHKRTGICMFFSLTVGGLLNQTLKNILCINRPWVRDSRVIPDEAALPKATGYSFPSGHSQMGVSIYGSIIPKVKGKCLRTIAVLAALLVAFSRNYLGVHTPQDVIVGLVIGALSVIVSVWLMDWVERKKGNDIRFVVILSMLTLIFLIFCSLKPYPREYVDGVLLVDPREMICDCYKIAGMLMGALWGWFCERKFVGFSTDVSLPTRILRGLIGTVGLLLVTFGVKILTKALPSWPGGFVSIFFICMYFTFIWPLIFFYFEKHKLKK